MPSEQSVFIGDSAKTLYLRSDSQVHVSAGAKILPGSSIQPSVSDPTGGATTDSEARAAINAIIDALQGVGILR